MLQPDWTVEIVTNGRDGHILYRESSSVASFYWEFGGGGVIAIINVGSAVEWIEEYPWSADRRTEVLERVIKEVIRQKAPTCTAKVDERDGVILLRKTKKAE
jgi:hypothetical protein